MFEVSSLIVSLCVHASVSVARVCVGVGGCVCGVALGSSWVTRAASLLLSEVPRGRGGTFSSNWFSYNLRYVSVCICVSKYMKHQSIDV